MQDESCDQIREIPQKNFNEVKSVQFENEPMDYNDSFGDIL